MCRYPYRRDQIPHRQYAKAQVTTDAISIFFEIFFVATRSTGILSSEPCWKSNEMIPGAGMPSLLNRLPSEVLQGRRDKVRGTITLELPQYEKNLRELVERLASEHGRRATADQRTVGLLG